MKIQVIFSEPTAGYWDGGKKSGGIFEIEPMAPKGMTKFGCYALNSYFSVKTGKTFKETAQKARRWINNHCRIPHSTKIIIE